MKKLLSVLSFVLVGIYVNAQCSSQVKFDVAASGDSNSSFSITTSHSNEIIMISYDGWPSPGIGPVTVDGNPATHINTAWVPSGNSGVSETYAYVAAAAGVHTIYCNPSNYGPPYNINMAAAFYATNCSSPFNVASLTSKIDTISGPTGGSITGAISTSVPGSVIYCNSEINEGQNISYPISWTGALFLYDNHEGNGIDAGHAYATAPTAGVYNIKATNSAVTNNGFGGLTMVLVVIPPPCSGSINLSTSHLNPSCSNNNGSASVTVSGGTPPYTYGWSPGGQTSATATGLSAGTYTVTVRDSSSCTATASVSLIINRDTATAAIAGHIACNGGRGSVSATVTGGTPPYTYSWAPTGGTFATANNLTSATYTVTVTDHGGCVSTASINLTQPPALVVNTTVNAAACNGGNGTATANASGGTGAFTYSWSPSGGTNAVASNLTAGTYTITVNDANGCTATAMATINAVTSESLSIMGTTDNTCYGGTNGSITTSTTGGLAPYTYVWSPSGGTNANAVNLTAGCYTVTVTDSNGCVATASACITQPAVRYYDSISSQTNIHCHSGNDGSATVGVIGGTGPYTYNWSPTGGTSTTITGLTAGCYSVTVTDSHGCVVTATACISQPAQLGGTISANPPIVCNGNCSLLSLSVSGGTSSFSYLWSDGNTSSSHSVCPLSNTKYWVTVTDSCSNTFKDSITVNISAPPVTSFSITQDTVCIYDSLDMLIGSPYGGTYSGPGVSGNNFNASNVGAGTYWVYYMYSDTNSCTAVDSLMVTVKPCILGTNELELLDKQVNLYPNPFNQSLTIEINVDQNVQIEICDMLGNKIGEALLNKGKHIINTENYAPGFYLMQIKTTGGIINRKLVKVN